MEGKLTKKLKNEGKTFREFGLIVQESSVMLILPNALKQQLEDENGDRKMKTKARTERKEVQFAGKHSISVHRNLHIF